MDRNLVKNVINGVNLVKIGHFWSKWSKLGHFGGKNDIICRHLGKCVKYLWTNIRFMDINVVKNLINGVNLVKIGHFWSKLGHFGGKNDVICQNLGKVVK